MLTPERLQRVRLATGVVLFAFVTTHLINHSLGNISLELMEIGRRVFLAVWRNPAGTTLLYGSVVVHTLLAAYAIYRRRSLRMTWGEGLQIVLGFSLPFWLATHVVANRGAHEFLAVTDTYTYVVLSLWLWDWQEGLFQAIATLVVWLHGCLGLYFWLRLKPSYPRVEVYFFAFAIVLPVAALAGFASAGKEAAHLAEDKLWLREQLQIIGLSGQEAVAWIHTQASNVHGGAIAFLVAVLALRGAHTAWERRKGRFTITYPDERRVTVDRGVSILEASRLAGIPHASVCGGRGRCSTCRVRIVSGGDAVPPASADEDKVLERIRAGHGVRLACQCRPDQDVSIIPLLPATAQAKEGFRRPGYLMGGEREIAILFADLRAFTKFSESKLPYDVVFVINQYFRAMGTAVANSNGHLDKFIGDGVMALFGVRSGLAAGCREALNGARAMAEALEALNAQLANDLDEPLRMGIGIHAGPAIVGQMGYGAATSLTAIGDAVNTASRLEQLTKELGCQLAVSQAVVEAAEIASFDYPARQVDIRGREETMTVYAVANATTLPTRQNDG